MSRRLYLSGRRVHIAGSASSGTEPQRVAYAHKIVDQVTREILARGGGIVLGVGREPRQSADSPPLTFDWTSLSAAFETIHASPNAWPRAKGQQIVIVSSEKGESEIPPERADLWQALLKSKEVRLERIAAGSRAAALVRRRQAEFGDALLILGGGFGVEDLASVYSAQRRPIIPLAISLGSSRGDGTGGALRLAGEARADPTRFLRLRPELSGLEGTRLAALSIRDENPVATEIAERIGALLDDLDLPVAFFTRLMNQEHEKFAAVEAFFRTVVDFVTDGEGYRRVEVGTDPLEHAFINVAIFEELHYAPLVIADVTGERPNCFIELGYALGRSTRVLATAARGTRLPFDEDKLPVHFWTPGAEPNQERVRFQSFWEKQINRPAIVR